MGLAVAVLALFCCSRQRSSPDLDAAIPEVVTTKTPPPPTPPDLSLFYASDVRGQVAAAQGSGGLSRRATLIDRARIEARAVVVVDAGDALPLRTDGEFGDGGDGFAQRVNLVLASYKRMGVAAMTPGERELGLGVERLTTLLRSANVHAVAANIVTKKGDLAFEQAAIIETPTISVGVFGILELPPESSADLERLGVATTDAAVAAGAATRSLREKGAGLVVGLFHVTGGAARAAEIVRQTGDIDVVVLAHASDGLKTGVTIEEGRTPIVYAGSLGSNVGRIDVRLNDAGGPRLEDHTLALTTSVPAQFGVGLLQRIEPARLRMAEEKAAAADRRRKGQKEPEVYENWTYGSTGACMLCHGAATEQWKTTDHAQAMAVLKKNHRERDLSCVGCHTTGYLQPGGTQNIDTALTQFAEVGCESCHGPSALHVRSIDKKKGTSLKVDATVCLGCHTPDQNLGPFDYEAALASILGPGHGAPSH
jgi:hypothetical protein